MRYFTFYFPLYILNQLFLIFYTLVIKVNENYVCKSYGFSLWLTRNHFLFDYMERSSRGDIK